MVVKVTRMFPSLQLPSFHPLSSALSLSVPPVAIRTCPRTLDICPDRPLPALDSPDITMKMCADGRESGTNAPVWPLWRFSAKSTSPSDGSSSDPTGQKNVEVPERSGFQAPIVV